jgi:hypothetical protein
LVSPFLSSRWQLLSNGAVLADLERSGRLHVSRLTVPNGEIAVLTPHEQGVVVALDEDGTELARITRRSWLGRRWEIESKKWAYDLVSNPRPRRWHVTIGGTPVAQVSGSIVSYNNIMIEAPLGVPILVIALAWHVVARPWEAAAAPATLIATPEEHADE